MKTKKQSKWARILAVMLALTMVFCDQSVLYASDSMADPVAVEAVAEPQVEEPAAAELVAETPVPQAEAQPQAQMETAAPVVAETEAPAPQTEVPAPVETEASAPAVIETEAPAPQSEAPAQPEPSAPETEEASDPATEAPAPAETEAPAPVQTEAPAETEAPVPAETEAPIHRDEPAAPGTEAPAPAETEAPAPAETEAPTETETEPATEPELKTFAMMMAISVQEGETVTVTRSVSGNEETITIPAGVFASIVDKEITVAGQTYEYQYAALKKNTADEAVTKLYAVAVYEGKIYVTTEAGQISGVEVGAGTDIVLYYKKKIDSFSVNYKVLVNNKEVDVTNGIAQTGNIVHTRIVGVSEIDSGETLNVAFAEKEGYEVDKVTYAMGDNSTETTVTKNGGKYSVERVTGNVMFRIYLKTKDKYNISFKGSNTQFKFDNATFVSGYFGGTHGIKTTKTYTPGESLSFELKGYDEWDEASRALNKLTITIGGAVTKIGVPTGAGTETTTLPNGITITVTRTESGKLPAYKVTMTAASGNVINGDIEVDTNFKNITSKEVWAVNLIGVEPLHYWDGNGWDNNKSGENGATAALDPAKFIYGSRSGDFYVYIEIADGYKKDKAPVVSAMCDGVAKTFTLQRVTNGSGIIKDCQYYFVIPSDETAEDIRISVVAERESLKFGARYDYNDGIDENDPNSTELVDSNTYAVGDTIKIQDIKLVRDGFVFTGWELKNNTDLLKKDSPVSVLADDAKEGGRATRNSQTDIYEYIFVAKWEKEEDFGRYPYAINVYFDDAQEWTTTEYGPSERNAYVNLLNIKDIVNTKKIKEALGLEETDDLWTYYEVDSAQTNTSTAITKDGQASINICFKHKIPTVKITGKHDTKPYNGTEQTVSGYTDNAPTGVTVSLKKGKVAEAKGTDVGKYFMKLTEDDFVIDKGKYKEVEVEIEDGYLEITPNTDEVIVTIIGYSDSTTYDGNEHVVSGYDVESISNGYYTVNDFTFSGSAEVKGTNARSYPMGLKEADFTNNSGNFTNVTFVVTDGNLTISKCPVSFIGESGTRTYNGDTQSLTGVEVNGLLEGHTSNVKAKAEGKDVGNYPGTITAKEDVIIKAGENDVTANYEITTNPGKLEITPSTDEVIVTIIGHSDSTTYDGNEHVISGYDVKNINNSYYTVNDFDFNGNAEVKGINADSYPMGLKATDFTNNSKKFKNVTFVVLDGGLTISKRPVSFTGESGTRVYDGTTQSLTGVEIKGLLKDHTSNVEAKAEGKDVGNYLGTITAKEDVTIRAGENDVTGNYEITTTAGELTIDTAEKLTVTITGNHDTKIYNGSEQQVTGYTSNAPEDVKVTLKAGKTAKASGINVGAYYMGLSEEDFTAESANYENIEVVVHDGYLEITPAAKAKVTITGNHDKKVYNGTEQKVTGYTIDAPATVNVTPREGLEAKASGINVGTYYMGLSEENFTAESANYENIEVVVRDGYLEITPAAKAKVTITGNHDTKVYNGTEQEVTDYTIDAPATVNVTPREGLEAKASGINVGTYYMGLSEEDFTAESANYENIEVVVHDGYLEITPITDEITVTITEHSATAKYDGTAHSATGYDTEIDHVLYTINDFIFKGTAEVTAIDANTYDMKLVPGDFKNISKNFTNVTFKIIDGTLTITKRTVTLTSATDSKSYDGTPLTNHTITVSGDGWAEGEGADYSVTGSQLYVGSSKNYFDYTLYGGDSEVEIQSAEAEKVPTKASNYEITKVYGSLTVTDEDVTDVVTKTHDGESYGLNDTVKFTITVVNIYNTPQDITITEQKGVTITGQSKFEGVQPGGIVTTTAEYTITEADILNNSFKNTATATFSNGKDHEGTDEVIPDDQNPSLLVEKKADQKEGGYRLNDEIIYTITVTNNGNVTMRNIIVNDDLTGMTKTINFLTPGASESFKTTYTVTEADILAGTILNVATATGMTPNEEYIETKDSEEIDTEPKNGHLTVNKTTTSTPKNGEAYALGETIFYEITVTNDGNLTITEIEVSDALTGNIGENAWKIDSLAPGEKRTVSTSYTVTEKDILAGKVVNEATAKGTSPDPEKPDVPVEPGKTEDPTDPAKTRLQVVKETISTPADGKTAYALGETIEYKLTVTNTGNLTVENVKVFDELTGNIGENALVVEEPLAPGKSAVFYVSYTVTEKDILAGKVVNEATATGTSTNPEDPEVPVEPGKTEDPTDPAKAHLTVTKETTSTPANGKTYALGETISYRIIVKNTGNLTVTNIEVTDALTGNTGSNAWHIDTLAPGEIATFTTGYTVTEKDLLAGKVVNEATAKGASPDPENPEVPVDPGKTEDPTDPKNGHLNVTKTTTSTPANGSAYALGETIAYEITVTNDGNLTITDIEVTDALTGNTGDHAWHIDTLAPGESKTFTASYTVVEKDLLAGQVHNEATAKGTSPDPDKPEVPVDPGTKDDPTVKAEPSLFVDKEANQKAGGYALGEEVTYTIRVLNNGNVTISNITVTDEMTGLNEIIPCLAVGEEKTFTTTHKVTEEDILKGKILNVATAKGTDPNGNPVEKEDSKEIDTEPKNAHVTVNKTTTSIPADGKTYTAGEKISYQITVTNDGNLTAKDLIVTDELTGNTGDKAWKIETLAPGESKTFTAEYTVTEADAQAGKVINVATAAGKSPDPDKPEIPATPGTSEVPTLDDSGTIQITKQLTLDGETVTAKGATFYVALYEDEATTVRLTGEKALTYDGTSSATVTFDHIVIGKTYYLSETDGNGNAITSGNIDGNLYKADFVNGRSVTVNETKGTAALSFTNVFMELPDNFYKDARLTITKKLLDADGKAKKSNETFYIGLFADAAHTQLTDRTTDNLVALNLNGDSEAGTTVSIVVSPTTPATLYIAEVDRNGRPVDDDFAYDVTIDNAEITLTETDNTASVAVTNQEKAEEPTEPDTEEPTEPATEEPTEKPTETEPETEPQTAKTTEKPADTTTKAPKTGDDTNIWFYMTLMMLAVLAGTGYTVRVRRKRRTK